MIPPVNPYQDTFKGLPNDSPQKGHDLLKKRRLNSLNQWTLSPRKKGVLLASDVEHPEETEKSPLCIDRILQPIQTALNKYYVAIHGMSIQMEIELHVLEEDAFKKYKNKNVEALNGWSTEQGRKYKFNGKECFIDTIKKTTTCKQLKDLQTVSIGSVVDPFLYLQLFTGSTAGICPKALALTTIIEKPPTSFCAYTDEYIEIQDLYEKNRKLFKDFFSNRAHQIIFQETKSFFSFPSFIHLINSTLIDPQEERTVLAQGKEILIKQAEITQDLIAVTQHQKSQIANVIKRILEKKKTELSHFFKIKNQADDSLKEFKHLRETLQSTNVALTPANSLYLNFVKKLHEIEAEINNIQLMMKNKFEHIFKECKDIYSEIHSSLIHLEFLLNQQAIAQANLLSADSYFS